jgi:excisionase family DNA binding protein
MSADSIDTMRDRGHETSSCGGRTHPRNPPKSLLDADDVAAMLNVKPGWVYARARAGEIPCVKLGRYRKFRAEAIEHWIVNQERGA